MSRTKRRGLLPNSCEWTWEKKARDWSCGNPMCCGGEVARKARRPERARLKRDLRRDPESATGRMTAKWRAWSW